MKISDVKIVTQCLLCFSTHLSKAELPPPRSRESLKPELVSFVTQRRTARRGEWGIVPRGASREKSMCESATLQGGKLLCLFNNITIYCYCYYTSIAPIDFCFYFLRNNSNSLTSALWPIAIVWFAVSIDLTIDCSWVVLRFKSKPSNPWHGSKWLKIAQNCSIMALKWTLKGTYSNLFPAIAIVWPMLD